MVYGAAIKWNRIDAGIRSVRIISRGIFNDLAREIRKDISERLT